MIPIIPILPHLPGWVKNAFSTLGQALNPFEWFGKALRAVYNMLAWYFEFILSHRPNLLPSSTTDYLYGNSIGVAGVIAFATAMILFCVSVFWIKKSVQFVEALVICFIISIVGPSLFVGFDIMSDFGNKLSKAAMFYHPTGQHAGLLTIAIDSTVNPILLIAAFFPTAVLGALNVFVLYFYVALSVIVKFLFLPTFALIPFGDKMKSIFSWLVSAAVVGMTIGVPVMIFSIEIGQLMADITGGSAAATVFFLMAGLVGALYAQVKLFQQVHRVVARFTGTMAAKVWGQVETIAKKTAKVDINRVNNRNANTMVPIPVGMPAKQHRAPRRAVSYVGSEIKTQTKFAVLSKVAAKATTTAAAPATGGSSIALAAAATAAERAARRHS